MNENIDHVIVFENTVHFEVWFESSDCLKRRNLMHIIVLPDKVLTMALKVNSSGLYKPLFKIAVQLIHTHIFPLICFHLTNISKQ